MRILSYSSLGILALIQAVSSQDHHKTEKESEREIEEAFRSAYSNRSEEISEFFNRTFGPGGDAEDIGRRFKKAWKGASEGVQQFVNETYWNISRTLRPEDKPNGSSSLEDITARISLSASEAHAHSKSQKHEAHRTPDDEEPQEHQSVLDSAWNYFKSVFGVSTKGGPPGAAMSASSSMVSPTTGGITLGVFTILAGVLLLVQAGLNRNSWINKSATSSADTPLMTEVPSGYVRIT
jgi:hypothetical protein